MRATRTTFPPGGIQPVCCRARVTRSMRSHSSAPATRSAVPRGIAMTRHCSFAREEFDFCLRAIERGWRIRYRGDIAVRHQGLPRPPRHLVRLTLVLFRAQPALHRAQMGCWVVWTAAGIAYYLIRGARNGVLRQTLRALPAAIQLSCGVAVQCHSPAARRYLLRNDTAYRGRWISTLWHACQDGFCSAQPMYVENGTMGQVA